MGSRHSQPDGAEWALGVCSEPWGPNQPHSYSSRDLSPASQMHTPSKKQPPTRLGFTLSLFTPLTT